MLGSFLLLIMVLAIGYILYTKITDIKMSETGKKIAGLTILIGLVVGASSFIPAIGGPFWQAIPPERPTPPQPTITVEDTGIVAGSVAKLYAIPAEYVQDAIVSVSLSEPQRNVSWRKIVSDNTNSDGTFMIQVPHITSGTVWISADKENYYPAKQSTTIPGASIYPPESLWVTPDLTETGVIAWSITENSTGCTVSGTTITENVTTSTSHYFDLELTVTDPETAIRDLELLEIRGGDWDNLGASVSVYVKEMPSYLSARTVGDVTLVDSYTSEIQVVGEHQWGDTITLHFTLSVQNANDAKDHLVIHLDDLLGAKDFNDGTGASEIILTIVTAT